MLQVCGVSGLALAEVLSRVKVGQPHDMAELMAEGADSRRLHFIVFVAAAIMVDFLSVEGQGKGVAVIVLLSLELPLVGPYRLGGPNEAAPWSA